MGKSPSCHGEVIQNREVIQNMEVIQNGEVTQVGEVTQNGEVILNGGCRRRGVVDKSGLLMVTLSLDFLIGNKCKELFKGGWTINPAV